MTLIDNRMEQPLPRHVHKVLETMFAAYSQVIVKSEFSEGFSGSRVFLVRPIREDGRTELPSVVKVDDFDRIEKEWQAYQDCIHNRLPNVARISGEPVYPPDSQHGGLRYPLAGDDAFDVVSLQDYCRQASLENIAYVLNRLFKSLENLWRQKNFQAVFHLHAAYDSFLHPNLQVEYTAMSSEARSNPLRPDTIQKQSQSFRIGDVIQLSGFQVVRMLRKNRAIVLDMPEHLPGAYRLVAQSVPDIAAYKVGQIIESFAGRVTQTRMDALYEQAEQIVGAGVDLTANTLPLPNNTTLPNPLVALPKLLNQSFDAYTACIHADLHLGNVLVEPESGNIHLIDFVNAREDHVLRDFLNLELAIVNRLIPAALDEADFSPKRIIPFYERLHCALRYPGQISPPPKLEKPFAMLRIIREAAAHYLFKRGEWHEYYNGLVIYLLGSLRYDDLNKVPGAKQTAFWGAAAVLNLLEGEVSCAEFGDGHDAKTPSPPPDPQEDKSGKGDSFDNRSGGVHFGGTGDVKIGGDVVGGNQTKTQFHGQVSGPIHTGSGDINITNRKEKLVDRPGFTHLRLDTAVPNKVYRAQPFDVAVAIRQPTTPVLAVDELNRVKSGSLKPSWPPNATSIRLRVEINAPDCEIQGADNYSFQLYKEQDSPVFYFKLISRNLGEISLIFTVYQEVFFIGSARAQTLVHDEIVGSVQSKVSSYAIKQRGNLRQILTKKFNNSELKSLSFDLGIDYENLPGRTKQGKARELITYLERRDRIPELVQACHQLRPNAPWWSTLENITMNKQVENHPENAVQKAGNESIKINTHQEKSPSKTESISIVALVVIFAVVALIVIFVIYLISKNPELIPTITISTPATATLSSPSPTLVQAIVASATPEPTSTLDPTKTPTATPTSSPIPTPTPAPICPDVELQSLELTLAGGTPRSYEDEDRDRRIEIPLTPNDIRNQANILITTTLTNTNDCICHWVLDKIEITRPAQDCAFLFNLPEEKPATIDLVLEVGDKNFVFAIKVPETGR